MLGSTARIPTITITTTSRCIWVSLVGLRHTTTTTGRRQFRVCPQRQTLLLP